MSQNIEKTLKIIADLVQSSRVEATRPLIRELAGKRLTREQRLELAYRSRQAELPELSLRLLGPVGSAGAKGRATRRPTVPERIEFALALAELNAAREARKVLAEIDLRQFPRAIRPMAMAFFREWDWLTPLPQLEWLIHHPDASESDRFGAGILLGAGRLHGQGDYEGARTALEAVIRETGPDYFPFAHRNALQVLAQNYFFQREHRQAMRELDRAEKIRVPGDASNLDMVVEQWRAIVAYGISAQPATELARLRAIRARFAGLDRYENVRACSYYEALLTRDEKLLAENYYGNPFPTYRKKILAAFGAGPEAIPPYYVFSVGEGRPRVRLELLDGRNTAGDARLQAGQVQQRLLWALCADFFVPPRAALLHERLYPDELYRPGPSLVRVSQAMKRLRQWLDEARIPLVIEERRGRYRLASPAGIQLRIDRKLLGEAGEASAATSESGPVADGGLKLHAALETLTRAFGPRPFRAGEAAERLGRSGFTALALLREGREAGRIEKLSAGPRTRYRLR